VIVCTSQCTIASRKRKTSGFRTEEELADVVNEIVTVIQIQIIFPNFQVVRRVIMRVTFQHRALAADR